jgi:hypothetical protein
LTDKVSVVSLSVIFSNRTRRATKLVGDEAADAKEAEAEACGGDPEQLWVH